MNNDYVSALFVLIAMGLAVIALFGVQDQVRASLTLGTALVFAILSISVKDDYE